MADILKIGTHNGQFHCDEILACYMLKQLPLYSNSTIIRSRDEKELEKCDIVVDVGGVYDLSKKRFDHHQKSFSETFSSIVPNKPWNIKLSSAGLIYVHFGKNVLEEVLKKLSAFDHKLVDILYDKMYEQFVREVDAIDNGIEIAAEKKYEITTNLSARVSHFNPAWNDENPDENKQFHQALEYVGKEFENRIKYYALVWWPARSAVYEAVQSRFEIDASGAILVLKSPVPWKSHLFDIEKELNIVNAELKFVIYNDKNDKSFRIQCVPENENSFINRLSLPEKWRGLRDQELCFISKIDECVFVHASGFIGGNKTLDGALKMARETMKI